MNSSIKQLIERLEEFCDSEEELDEMNDTGSGGEYMTPNAFSKKTKKPDDSSYSKEVQETDRFFKKIDEISRLVSEASYNDFKADNTRSERQKINGNIIEINRKLREVEQMITHASKLKLETGAGEDVYWKKTLGNFLKIKERLNRLSGKIVEMAG